MYWYLLVMGIKLSGSNSCKSGKNTILTKFYNSDNFNFTLEPRGATSAKTFTKFTWLGEPWYGSKVKLCLNTSNSQTLSIQYHCLICRLKNRI